MMELPRACQTADQIVATDAVEFMSFGTNVSASSSINVLVVVLMMAGVGRVGQLNMCVETIHYFKGINVTVLEVMRQFIMYILG